MKKVVKPIAAFAAALLGVSAGTQAQADVICAGVPVTVMTDWNGYVLADWGFGPFYFCNVSSAVTGTTGQTPLSPDECKVLLSQMMTAQASGKRFGVYFFDITSCSMIGSPNAWPSVRYPNFYLLSN